MLTTSDRVIVWDYERGKDGGRQKNTTRTPEMRDYFVKVSKETESKTYRVLYRQDKVPDDDFITHQTTFFVILG